MPTPPTPLDSLWKPQALIATVLAGEALALILTLAPSRPHDFWIHFGLASLMIQWISLLTLLLIYLMRRRLGSVAPPIVAWCCFGLLIAVTSVIAWIGSELVLADWTSESTSQLFFLMRAIVIAAIVGLLALISFQNYSEAKWHALRVKQAELEALQARIRPHFLFNTLNSATALVHGKPHDAEKVLLDLGDLFRAAMAKPGWVPLAQEVELCQRYLAIEEKRFGDRLQFSWSLPDDISNLFVPLLTIQPLLENAVTHGLEGGTGKKTLEVEIRSSSQALTISIKNPMPDQSTSPRREGHGVGQSGVRARIEAATEGAGSLKIDNRMGVYHAQVTVPRTSMPVALTQATSS